MEHLTHHVFAAARALSVLSLALDAGDRALAARVLAELWTELVAVEDALERVSPTERDAAQRLVDALQARTRSLAPC